MNMNYEIQQNKKFPPNNMLELHTAQPRGPKTYLPQREKTNNMYIPMFTFVNYCGLLIVINYNTNIIIIGKYAKNIV